MTKAKPTKSAADAKKTDAKAIKNKADELEDDATANGDKKAADKAVKKPVKEKTEDKATKKASSDTDIIPKPEGPRPAVGFSNAGIGIKIASKKPALSVAPGVMILGRSAQVKQEQAPRPSERRLSKKEQAEIKTFLMEKRERLLAGMRRELAMQKERADSKAADEVDKATDAYDEDLSFEIATANDMELEDIQVALEKIERGTYGECEICGCAISPSRLKILPSATTCVSCRGQEEMARRRDDSPMFSMLSEEAESDGEQA